MPKAITSTDLRNLFQNPFCLKEWTSVLKNFFGAEEVYDRKPEAIDTPSNDISAYSLGWLNTSDTYQIALLYYRFKSGSVVRRKVGLRQLANSLAKRIKTDAALAVFDDGKHWRLSFICDLKDEKTSPKRFSYVFGCSEHLYRTPISRFQELQNNGISFANIRDAFNVEAVTKEFYIKLYNWYEWAQRPEFNVTFPNRIDTSSDDRDNLNEHLIRLITRLIFVWFIKQKGLVSEKLFSPKDLKAILKSFDPLAGNHGNGCKPQTVEATCYYQAILQNLFFATLNKAMDERRFVYDGDDKAQRKVEYGVKTFYRYEDQFTKSGKDEIIQCFSQTPFLNGGLFECLDKSNPTAANPNRIVYYDGFSRVADRKNGNFVKRAFIPNILFFNTDETCPGLINLLQQYNFTIEENSPNDVVVALDPELLGKVFENLLASYNPETAETARNATGSFYTPREIVHYMVNEMILDRLTTAHSSIPKEALYDLIYGDECPAAIKPKQRTELVKTLKQSKFLDPACGSGAFPMGILQCMLDILKKLQVSPSEEDLEGANSAYATKLSIIENCLYGVDIQPIAVQIAKLRCFISLIIEEHPNADKPNLGIPTLPNLETKFVCADTLMPLSINTSRKSMSLFDYYTRELNALKNELLSVRHDHFKASTYQDKTALRNKDKEIRAELTKLFENNKTTASDDIALVTAWDPYDQNASSKFFDPEWMFTVTGGFDGVIGNPPYIQLQANGGLLGERYRPCGYQVFAKTGDMYCLFYERSHQLIKPNGSVCLITSNKWMRAGYGESLRGFLATETDPRLLVDFAGEKVFESATVDVNILLFKKAQNSGQTLACSMTKDGRNNMSLFVQQNGTLTDFSPSAHELGSSWSILSSIELSIKRKIEAVGKPLKDWDIKIYRGILTGCNEAFIIDGAKREEILNNCKTTAERERTDALIRPILRGRDIKRYSYTWGNLYLIATFPSRHYNINDYPAVKEYLLTFGKERLEQTGKEYIVNGERIKARKKTSNKWFETQDSISYWEDFLKQKIVWKRIGSILRFSYDEKGLFGLDSTCIMIGDDVQIICTMLNSYMGQYLLKESPKTGTGDLIVSVQALEPILLPKIIDRVSLKKLLQHQMKHYNNDIQIKINNIVYKAYGLDENEMTFVDSYTKRFR